MFVLGLSGLDRSGFARSTILECSIANCALRSDGSARVQTVLPDDNPLFYQLLEAFERETDMSVLLNTSFDVRGQPIVRSGEAAVKAFSEGRLGALAIGHYLALPIGNEINNS